MRYDQRRHDPWIGAGLLLVCDLMVFAAGVGLGALLPK